MQLTPRRSGSKPRPMPRSMPGSARRPYKLEMKTEDGTEYLFEVPPGALIWPEYVTMRPVASVKGLPGKGVLAGGVSFEPKGLGIRRPRQPAHHACQAGGQEKTFPWPGNSRGAARGHG